MPSALVCGLFSQQDGQQGRHGHDDARGGLIKRFGDPECEVLMPRFDGDLVATLLACAEGRLAEVGPLRFSDRVALTVIMAATGYPATPETGGAIGGIDAAEAAGAIVFQAGTKMAEGRLVASGGRVLAVTAEGPTVRWAQAAAYAAVDRIDFPTGFCRRDIRRREVPPQAAHPAPPPPCQAPRPPPKAKLSPSGGAWWTSRR